jgi:D-alanyl-D-alanine carboxypeptidase (penicillin-binding protein 5/6)
MTVTGSARTVAHSGIIRRTVAFLLVAVLSMWPTLCVAEVLSSDTVGDARVSSSPDLAAAAPDVEVPAGILVTDEGRTLWAREASEARPMASTTKMMTGLLVLEAADPDEEVVVSTEAASVGGSGVDLRAGEVLNVRELLLALLMESSNSAAHALAEHVAGSVDAFVARMNDRAEEMGLEDTRFRNPHGLDAEGHESSAEDLAELAQLALEDPAFARVVGRRTAVIGGPDGPRTLENSNQLLGRVPGADGVKTGWTTPAGYCLVASAERDGIRLLAVVLGADSEEERFVQAEDLLEWGFEHYRRVELTSGEETLGPVAIADWVDREISLRVEREASAVLLDLEGPLEKEWEMPLVVDAPVDYGEPLGSLTVYQGSEALTTVPLVSTSAVAEPTAWQRFTQFLTRVWRAVIDRS